jgi:putative NADPH-quinone reductase
MSSKKVLIINGNPDPSPERLSSAIAAAYREGAIKSGHDVCKIDVGAVDLHFLRTSMDFMHPPTERPVMEAQAAFVSADHVVFIYPLWLGGPPALLKAFMERLGCGQFLLQERKGSFPQGALKGRSARVIVTMGMLPLLYRTVFGAHGVKAFNRSILRISGIAPVRTSYFGGSTIMSPRNGRLIEQVHEMGRRAA